MPNPVAFFHWLQGTWLAPKPEAAGFVFPNESPHCPPCYAVGIIQM